MRRLGTQQSFIQAEFGMSEEEARRLLRALTRAGLIQRIRVKVENAWTITQLGQSLSIAKACKPIARKTAEKVLAQFMERVLKVNHKDCFLAKVTGVVLFGSMLRLEVDRLGDIDIAVQIEAKGDSAERLAN
jgi:DNA-binding Lrp family transcriptional regulator